MRMAAEIGFDMTIQPFVIDPDVVPRMRVFYGACRSCVLPELMPINHMVGILSDYAINHSKKSQPSWHAPHEDVLEVWRKSFSACSLSSCEASSRTDDKICYFQSRLIHRLGHKAIIERNFLASPFEV